MKRQRRAILLAIVVVIGSTFPAGRGFSQQRDSRIPTPAAVFGFEPGAEGRLVNYDQMVAYLKTLDHLSPRLSVQELGNTTEGRSMILVIISAPQNLEKQAQIMAEQKRLADPRLLHPAQAKRMARELPAVVSINCSIHAREVGPSQMASQLAYELTSGNSQAVRAILDHVVLLLIPSHNPDGMDKVAEWYGKYSNTAYENGPFPFLEQQYCGHDLNRDWFMLTQPETRLTVQQVFNIWHPQVIYDLHQMGPYGARMFLPPFTDPYDDMIHPVLQAGLAALGTGMILDLTAAGFAGVTFGVYFDSFSPARNYVHYHGGMRVLGEIASARIATSMNIAASEIRVAGDFEPGQRSWRLPLPWKSSVWALKDVVGYAFQSSMALLDYSARNRERLIWNAYQVLADAAADEEEKPTFLLDPAKSPEDAVAELLSVLSNGLVEIYRAQAGFTSSGIDYPRGTFIVPSAQPFGDYARTLLQSRPYPTRLRDSKRIPVPPYDVTSHHLPTLFGVEVAATGEKLNVPLQRVISFSRKPGRLTSYAGAEWFFLDYGTTQAVKALQSLYQVPGQLFWLADSVREQEQLILPGSILIHTKEIRRLEQIASEAYTDIRAISPPAGLRVFPLTKPRVGLYQSRLANMDEGWTRFVLEKYLIDYRTLTDPEIRESPLEGQFDVIILPHQTAEGIINGAKEGAMPPEFCRGIGQIGLQRLREFVKNGGTLIALGNATEVPLQHFELTVRNGLLDIKHEDYFAPGAFLSGVVHARHPLGFGLPRRIAVFNYQGPVFDGINFHSIVTYPGANLLRDGWLTGENLLALKSAIAEVPYDKGRVILFGIRPQFRAQTFGTFKLLFNAIIRGSAQPIVLSE